MPPTSRKATPGRTPQDHKPPAPTLVESPDLFWFNGADDQRHSLPPAGEAAGAVSGRMLRDALRDPDGEARLALHMLDHCGAAPADLDALLDLPGTQFLPLIGEWVRWSRENGVSLGESSGSAG